MIVTYQWIQFICKFFLEWMPVFPCAPGNCREWYIYIYIIVFNLVPWFLDEVGYWQILKYNSHFKRKLVANFKLIYQKQKAFHFDFYIVSQVVLVLRSSMQLVLWLQPLSGELSTGILAFMVYDDNSQTLLFLCLLDMSSTEASHDDTPPSSLSSCITWDFILLLPSLC